MAYTVDQLNAIIASLEASLQSGALRVAFEGRSIENRSSADLMELIAYWKNQLAGVTVTGGRKRVIRASSSSGHGL